MNRKLSLHCGNYSRGVWSPSLVLLHIPAQILLKITACQHRPPQICSCAPAILFFLILKSCPFLNSYPYESVVLRLFANFGSSLSKDVKNSHLQYFAWENTVILGHMITEKSLIIPLVFTWYQISIMDIWWYL